MFHDGVVCVMCRYDPRRNQWYDQGPPDGPGRETGGPHDIPSKGRGYEWKDPWLR